MRSKLLQIPFFPFLLPVFFVLHGFVENASFVSPRNCYGLVLLYLLVAVVLFALLYPFYRNAKRAALALVALQAVSFFFGAMQDFLIRHARFLNNYSILLPFLAILLTGTLIWLKKTSRNLAPIVLFLNILLIVYFLIDGTQAFFVAHQHKERLAVTPPSQQDAHPCDTCSYPDVYLLLMDEYAGTSALKKWFGYDDSELDSFLRDKGFHIQSESRSNYNYTLFSMASILNMSYVKGLGPGNTYTIADHASCTNLIRNSDVVRQFASHGYDIVNYSIFDLESKPSDVNLHFLPVKANLISGQTLWSRMRHDLGVRIYSTLPAQVVRKQAYQLLDDNSRFIDGVIRQSRTPSAHPRFVYAHLEMPHAPFFYDKHGILQDPKALEERKGIRPYLDYLPYTNGVIKDLVTAIQQNTNNSALIILMGDHGVRYDAPGDPGNVHHFQNLNAIFFPDKDYHLLYDSISGVNQFRVIFSSIFRQNIPLLKDSTVFLTDKHF